MKEKEIYLAGGCFWGTEHYFKLIEGVVETEVGFANGHTANPTYKEVYTDTTGYVETVYVKYNPDVVSLEFLLQMFFKAIDPTSLNKQGHDEGTRYRTGIYYTDSEDLPVIEKVFAEEQKNYQQPLVVEKLPLENFYTAEEYHQDYLDKNPTGYCHLPQSLFEFAKKAKVSGAMKKSILLIYATLMLLACGGQKTQTENEAAADSTDIEVQVEEGSLTAAQAQEQEAIRAFVDQFYKGWDREDLLEYDYPKQHITPNLLKYLADAYDFDCEGECLATWKFFYEGGGDVGELKSRQITARDENHVLVENKYENYAYDVLLTVIKDGDTFKIDSLKQERSEYTE